MGIPAYIASGLMVDHLPESIFQVCILYSRGKHMHYNHDEEHIFCSDNAMGSTNVLVSSPGKQPLFSFGVISDVQYADIPDGHSFIGVPRYYQHSIRVLQRAVKKWNNHQNLNFVINVGDIVDGKCPPDQSLDVVKKVNNEFQKFKGPVFHLIGNHYLYNLPRDKLLPLLKTPGLNGHAYYDFSPGPEYRIVVLDGDGISAIGWPRGHPKTLQALEFQEKKKVIVCCHLPLDLFVPHLKKHFFGTLMK